MSRGSNGSHHTELNRAPGISGYGGGCRCDECRAGRAAYMRVKRPQYSYDESRSGPRGERKRAWDQRHRRRCACGRLTGRYDTERCAECRRRGDREHRDERRKEISRLWAQGESLKDIAQVLGSTPGSIGVEVVRMRSDGWSLSYRRPAKAVAA